MGFCAVHRLDVKRIAHDFLWNFHERTKISTYLTIPCGNQSLCVDRVVSDNTGRLSSVFVGEVYPLFTSRASNREYYWHFTSLLNFKATRLNSLELAEEEKTPAEGGFESCSSSWI